MNSVAPFTALNSTQSTAFRADSTAFNYAAGYRRGYVVRLDDFEHHEFHNGAWRQYAPAGVSDGLVAWYWPRDFIARVDSSELSEWRDWSGNQHDLVAATDEETIIATIGSQRASDARNLSSARLSDDATITELDGESLTLSARIAFEDDGSTRSAIQFYRGLSTACYWLYAGANVIASVITTGGTNGTIAYTLPDGDWHTYTIVHDGAQFALYVDGVLIHSIDNVSGTFRVPQSIQLHNREVNDEYNGVAISQLAIYSTAKSDSEREAIEAWMARPSRYKGNLS